MNTFEMKTAIHFGDNALDRLKEIPYKRVLIITDPFVVQSKMINLITAPLNSAGIEYDIFHDVVPDAPVDKIAEGVKKFLEYQPEAVVAVGGGSAIDSSKAIREFALKINNYGKVGLIAIPTTSGTGSEVTSFAVVNDTAAHVKYPLISESLTADEAILDAELVRSVPPAITADTGMDVFTHALESYVSTAHNVSYSYFLCQTGYRHFTLNFSKCFFQRSVGSLSVTIISTSFMLPATENAV